MKNISTIISGHNKSLLRQENRLRQENPTRKNCNCRNPEQCPLGGKCLTDNIIYEAEITSHPDEIVRDYRGLCSTTFKARWGVHKEGINHRKYAKSCELTKYVWEIKDKNQTFDIKWKILKRVNGRLIGGACKLCTTEKLFIIEHPEPKKLLNSNCITKCRHEGKYMLSAVGTTDMVEGERDIDSMD